MELALNDLTAPATAAETGTAADAGFGATGLAQELGRDEFLALLVAKLENQDPLNPAEDTEFVAELATFSSLEQLINVNDNLEAMTLSQQQLVNSQTLGLIGKEALIESGGSIRIRDGRPDPMVYVMPRAAREATLTVYDEQGAPARVLELERLPNGRLTLDWDGTDENGEPLSDGEYRMELNVTDDEGEPMAIGLFRSLRIDGVAFLDGEISLVSGNYEIPFESILEIREPL